MKIAIIFPKDSESFFNPKSNKTFGGATVQMFNYAKSLKKNHQVVSFLAEFEDSAKENLEEINGEFVYNTGDNFFVKVYSLHKAISTSRPEVILQHGLTYFTVLLSIYCYFKKIKFVFMFAHDVEVSGCSQSTNEKNYLFGIFLRSLPVLVTQNAYQQKVIKDLGYDPIRINNGFEIPVKNYSTNNKNVLWVARCEKWKQPEIFIKLARLNPDFQFVMICPKVEQVYFDKIKNLAIKEKNLIFYDFVTFHNVEKYFLDSRIFVNTSLTEGFPQTFIQAAIAAVPILSLTVDPDSIFSRFKIGITSNSDENQLNTSLRNLFFDDNLHRILSENIYNYAVENHNIDRNVDKLISFL